MSRPKRFPRDFHRAARKPTMARTGPPSSAFVHRLNGENGVSHVTMVLAEYANAMAVTHAMAPTHAPTASRRWSSRRGFTANE